MSLPSFFTYTPWNVILPCAWRAPCLKQHSPLIMNSTDFIFLQIWGTTLVDKMQHERHSKVEKKFQGGTGGQGNIKYDICPFRFFMLQAHADPQNAE